MLEKGLKHISRTVVQPDNFALTMGSGDLPVLATPALVALMENAAMLAVAAELPEGATTVGAKMDMTHVRPSGEGKANHHFDCCEKRNMKLPICRYLRPAE